MKKKWYTMDEVMARIKKRSEDIQSGKIKLKPIQKIEATEFVKSQVTAKILKMLPRIVNDATDILNLYPKDCPKGLYPFSRIVPLYGEPYNKLRCPIVKITNQNKKFLVSDYSARRKSEIPYLKRWFPKRSKVEGVLADHIDVILYNKAQLVKEGDKIKSDWGIVAINVEMKKGSPVTPQTMVNNQMGIKFGGNGEKINVEDYLASIEFWQKHAILER